MLINSFFYRNKEKKTQRKKKFMLKLCFVGLLLVIVKADLPVHCLKSQVVGKWKLELSKVELVGILSAN